MKIIRRIPLVNMNIYVLKILMSISLFVLMFACSAKTDFITTESGLQYKIVKSGEGAVAATGQEVIIHETTKYTNNALVFSSRNMPNPLKILLGGNQVIKGVEEGLLGMKKGEIRKLIVPPVLSRRTGNITFPHPDSTLLYEIELIDIIDKESVSKTIKNGLRINKDKSSLRWEGFNKLHTGGHYGIVRFYSGEFYEIEKRIVGGEFIIDMNSIINTDGDYSEMLVDHLKNEDFFDTEKYPIAKLEMTQVKYTDASNILVKANLTIMDIQQPIEFEAQLESNDHGKILKSKFTIDRTRWNIMYKSGSVFGSFGDNLISDEIEFEVSIFTE